jgi:hypothetical protein
MAAYMLGFHVKYLPVWRLYNSYLVKILFAQSATTARMYILFEALKNACLLNWKREDLCKY